MTDLLAEMRTHEDSMESCTSTLYNLSKSFYAVGNEKVADDLKVVCTEIMRSVRNLRKAVNENLDKEYKNAVQSSANVLNSALAGIKLQKAVSEQIVKPEPTPMAGNGPMPHGA
jgi:hypothetical protein